MIIEPAGGGQTLCRPANVRSSCDKLESGPIFASDNWPVAQEKWRRQIMDRLKTEGNEMFCAFV